MKPLLKIAFLSIACFPCFCINNAAGSEDVIPGSQKIDRENSIINPIILTGIKKTDDIRESQKEYIRKHCEGYGILGYIYTMHDGKYIQIISIRNDQGQEKLIYFDMTDIYRKLGKSRDKKTRKDIKRLIEDHKPLEKEPAESV